VNALLRDTDLDIAGGLCFGSSGCMFLREIVINGFKSFADRTRIVLRHGVTTIVGPNGCGKSNVVDAIRWVLGEQSAKALRGGKMEDVIFQGTDKRKPLHLCEVSLIFSDCEAQLGTAYNEVEVCRKVSREDGGEYFLNGKRCRLKDIQSLFMNTGIGQDAYSFMMQGKIDQILSNNPLERRIIFEEAAGITRYKTQRKETLCKLELVEQNLARALDLMQEVERQKNSLQQQAQKALRYQKTKHRLKHLELAHYALDYQHKQSLQLKLREEIKAIQSAIEALAQELKTHEAEIADKQNLKNDLHESLQGGQEKLFELRSQKDALHNQMQLLTLRQEDAQTRIEACSQERVKLQEAVVKLQQKAEEEALSKEEQAGSLGHSDEILKQEMEVLSSFEAKAQAVEAALSASRKTIQALELELKKAQQDKTHYEVDLKTNQAQQIPAQEQKHKLEQEKQALQRKLQDIQRHKREAQEESLQAQSAQQTQQAAFIEAQQAFKDIQRSIQEKERYIASKAAKKHTLEALQTKLEGFSEGTKAILDGRFALQEKFALLAQCIKVEPAYRAALEVLLGSALDAIFIHKAQDALSIFSHLEEEQLGRACLYLEAYTPPQQAAYSVDQSLFVAPGAFISLENEAFRPFLDIILKDSYIVQDMEEALAYLQAHPDFQFQCLVDAKGLCFDRRGLLQFGQDSPEKSFLHRENEIENLKQELEIAQSSLAELFETASSLQLRLDTLEQSLEEHRAAWMEAEHSLKDCLAEERATQQMLNDKESNYSKIELHLETIENKIEELSLVFERAESRFQKQSQNLEEALKGLQEQEQSSHSLFEEKDAKRQSLAEVKLKLLQKQQTVVFLEQTIQNTLDEKRKLEDRIQALDREDAHLQAQVLKHNEDILAQEAACRSLDQAIQDSIHSLEAHRLELMELEKTFKHSENTLLEGRKAQTSLEKDLHKAELALAQETSHIQFLKEKALSDYEVPLEGVDWKTHLEAANEAFVNPLGFEEEAEDDALDAEDISTLENPTPKPSKKHKHKEPEGLKPALDEAAIDWKAIHQEIKTLKTRLNAIGSVNLSAIEDYLRLKERFIFLKTQTDDLHNSKEELNVAIDEMNKLSQTLFKETFVKIRANFSYTFDKLFGGGEADLILHDDEDPLEAGIDIIARPPGTKLRSLTLLSGGQKTMTAVALLFAIYMVKPSPFCVLDELDAPLDDANIGRFTEMLKQFTQYSQFLVISHNKRTIAASDTIYGVTMQERGVTTLISMKFDSKDSKDALLQKNS
jgi:chromosome segregation protein